MEQVLEAKQSLLASKMEMWTSQNLLGPIRCSYSVYDFYKRTKTDELCGFFLLSLALSKI